MEIIFNQDEKDNFISAINFLIHEVEACIQRNVLTQHGKVSVKGTSQKDINIKLDFLKKYNYSYKIGLGNAGGFLNEDSWIIFVRNDLLASNLINGEKLTATKGIYIFIAFSGYFSDDKHIQLSFGFPQGDMNLSRCSAIDQMDRSGKLRYFDFKYKDLEKEANQIVKDFQDMINYFNIFDKNDFKLRAEFSTFIPLNQILYGSPGTGKTYHTIDKALEILGKNLESRDDKKAKFDEYVKKGQIVFTTFHQSYGYEEFVEGIKPRIDSKENSKEIEYEIKDGIFKELCEKALDNYENSILNADELNKKIELKEKVENFLNWLLETNEPIGKTKGGNFFVVEIDNKTIVIYSEGVERFDGIFNLNLSIFMELLKCKDEFNNATEMFKKVFNRDYADRTHTYYFNLVKKFKAYEEKQLTAKIENNKNNDNSLKPYIIIIDEINRGNLSKIFGELITLIEPSKRIGEKEELKVTLPYSGEKFGVPKNVYIIGTMNTADRSITSLDTALRRRFEFVEMMPDVSKLSMDCEGINLQELLKAINTRIEYLLDREKTIGHAFFVSVENLESLKKVFKNRIIPLLQEYFYNDYALIDAVLNKNGMLEISVENKDYLKNMTEFIESDKIVYKFSDSNNWNKDTFIKIYK
ncbi:AAA family ATPase [Campylobacter jejuni]|uniref:AAA family ATPase n=1 Tax=Campylobacter jejuni TaxID=197 RepID=UPI00069A7383|nr:AAA family ATPase [Campylobacter jejuni]